MTIRNTPFFIFDPPVLADTAPNIASATMVKAYNAYIILDIGANKTTKRGSTPPAKKEAREARAA
jgi:hypothetical protein